MIICEKKLANSLKMNFGLWLSIVNLIGFEFDDFLILIELVFEL